MTHLTTARLRLRPMDERDVAAHYAVFADPEVVRYWSREPWTEIAQAEESIKAIMAAGVDGSEVRYRARRDGRHRERRAAQALLGRALSSPAGRIRPAAPSRPGSTGGRRGPRSPGHT
jgi:RimJ/RimL family protein N-acetyltransferase